MKKINTPSSTISLKLFPTKVPEQLMLITRILQENGFDAYLVGGAIRDLILKPDQTDHVKDFDFATNADPVSVQKLFKQKGYATVPTGIKHGTITVIIQDIHYEITTYRIDGDYSDGRRPDSVVFSSSIIEDLSRRDFTINAMAYDLVNESLLDPFNGFEDLKKKIIRTVGDPISRFQEDGLRPIRACRFAAVLQFEIETQTFEAIAQTLDIVKNVSMERVHDELFKLMAAPLPSVGLEYMRKSGILPLFIPELLEGYNIPQNEFHKYDIYYHNLYACDAAPSHLPLIRFAALFHDIGKARAKEYALKVGNGNVFYNHDY